MPTSPQPPLILSHKRVFQRMCIIINVEKKIRRVERFAMAVNFSCEEKGNTSRESELDWFQIMNLVVLVVNFSCILIYQGSFGLQKFEILSDSTKRAHYDMYLLSQRKVVQKAYRQGSTLYRYESKFTSNKEMEVVEWLRWYRMAVYNMLSEKRMVSGGTGYFDELEEDFYLAMHLAYFGLEIECFDNLLDRFEAEERSMDTPEEAPSSNVLACPCILNVRYRRCKSKENYCEGHGRDETI
ncbi:hypothetical protein ACFE04_014976 [Oxalis oulophora]